MKKSACVLPALLLAAACLGTARASDARASAWVDGTGTLRWTATGAEIVQFGVNYTAPFAYSYRAHAQLGVPITTAIDADTYHLARMGLDAFRVHVWDRQISDDAGNVVANEHLAAFDYLIHRLEQRGFKIVLTPLYFGDTSYPDGISSGEGFSRHFGKRGCLEDRTSWPLQERYLAQFVSHVNPHTGRPLKDDPQVIGFEICNEPGHFEYAPTVEYINTMVGAIRSTGCAKPLFYNMSHGMPVAEAYLDSNIQGGTFQWYPSGLVAGHEQWGNFLPYLEDYPIPFADNPKFKAKAKIAYEFDTADIGRTYLYPAIARSFRTAGFQFATQFAYDPLYLASCNTEYQTHFMNLAYAPQKALSLKIAAEAFRRVPRFKHYGAYPADTEFEGIHLSYADDLAELVTDTEFFYTNPTATVPPSPDRLQQVAGYGNSPIVRYPGQGAYFLDRLSDGVWRLEVMPDAIWMSDPFAKASPQKQVSRIAWNTWPMQIELPDLGSGFSVTGLNAGNGGHGQADERTVNVRPGAYLLVRSGVTSHWKSGDRWKNLTLSEFVAPPSSIDRDYVVHRPLPEAAAGTDLRITATVAAPGPVERVTLVAYLPRSPAEADARVRPNPRQQPGGGFTPGIGSPESLQPTEFPMQPDGLKYSVTLPGSKLRAGPLRYFIVVRRGGESVTFPSEVAGQPTDWDFAGQPWRTRLVPATAPILLFNAATDESQITYQDRAIRYGLVPADQPGSLALRMLVKQLDLGDHDESFRFFFKDHTAGRTAGFAAARRLVFYGRSGDGRPCPIQIAVVTSDGVAYGARITVGPEYGRHDIAVDALAPVPSPNIPYGYPVFLHHWYSPASPPPLDLTRAESVLVSIGPGLSADDLAHRHEVDIKRIWAE